MMVIGYSVTVVAHIMLLVPFNYTYLIFCLIIIGGCNTIRVQVGFIYMYETFKINHYSFTAAVLNVAEGIGGVTTVLYFIYVSKDVNGLIILALTCAMVGLITSFFYPESPRYLVKSEQDA